MGADTIEGIDLAYKIRGFGWSFVGNVAFQSPSLYLVDVSQCFIHNVVVYAMSEASIALKVVPTHNDTRC